MKPLSQRLAASQKRSHASATADDDNFLHGSDDDGGALDLPPQPAQKKHKAAAGKGKRTQEQEPGQWCLQGCVRCTVCVCDPYVCMHVCVTNVVCLLCMWAAQSSSDACEASKKLVCCLCGRQCDVGLVAGLAWGLNACNASQGLLALNHQSTGPPSQQPQQHLQLSIYCLACM